ncbi:MULTISPECIES: DUF202 domain-containing protein [unclassified Streptomyces]|uniref:DUF202 domain-containing protein n=1 Tax=unclassified Streptomyces TaxID=2593676 RepID=UPI00093C4D75|nr:DUF202 domain-containing protein [Streptomyces sp. CB02058]OKI90862.1 hypothetical protein AMK10_28535 [Streptomyces sp. CB02058]
MTSRTRDPGLQPERTRLAWRRTTLACTVVALLAVRQGLYGGTAGAGVLAVALSLLAWLGFLVVAHRRVSSMGAEPATLSPRHALAAAACTVALAVFAATALF